jgi:hypothetical protein
MEEGGWRERAARIPGERRNRNREGGGTGSGRAVEGMIRRKLCRLCEGRVEGDRTGKGVRYSHGRIILK